MLQTKWTKKKDLKRQTHPCKLTIKWNHNHSIGLDSAENLKNLKITNLTQEKFFAYFKKSMSPSQAFHVNEINLLATEGMQGLADKTQNPPYDTVFYLWRKFRREAVGSYCGEDMFDMIKTYSQTSPANIRLERNGQAFVCAIVSPLMKRIHQTMKESSEIVFVDTTSCIDRTNCSLTVMLCASPLAALPLGIIISSGQDEYCYVTGFNLLKTMLGDSAFFGKLHPAVFMTDDGEAEKNALKTVWPLTQQLLCVFHVLQAVWRWILDRKHAIDEAQRPTCLRLFKKLVYSINNTEFDNAYSALNDYCRDAQHSDGVEHSFLRYIPKNF